MDGKGSSFPSSLHRQLGRKEQTSHRSWQQGHFQCWQWPLGLHVTTNSPLTHPAVSRLSGVHLRTPWENRPPAGLRHLLALPSSVGQPWNHPLVPFLGYKLPLMFHSAVIKTAGATVRVY